MDHRFFTLLAAILGISSQAVTQPGKRNQGPLPVQGKTISEGEGFDEDGTPFHLPDLVKGHHTVVVFGCLT